MNKARILIVDDQKEILSSLAAVLADEGHELLTAGDGQEALHIVQSDSPDIVFLDIWIPGIDGMQTLKAIKRIDPDCSVIMMSGHGTIETAVKAIKLGAADYLEKPLNLDDVLHLVEKSLSKKRPKVRGVFPTASTENLIGDSLKIEELRRELEQAVQKPGNILLVGDKGVGKEFLVRVLHNLEEKDRTNLVKLRCSELTEDNVDEYLKNIIENDLSLNSKRKPKQGWTLLIARVDRLKPTLRDKVFEFLKRQLDALSGSSQPARIVSTSTFDRQALLAEGFSTDFADFISRKIIKIPPLAERIQDIPLLVRHFVREAAEEFDKTIEEVEDQAIDRLKEYSWPGNIKELKLLIEHVVMTAPGPQITVSDLVMPWVSIETVQASTLKNDPNANVIEVLGPTASKESSRMYQKTLRGRVVVYGQGLHSGNKTGLTLSPMPPSTGILFGHITSTGSIQANLDNVDSTGFSTCLRHDGVPARTIEHLMAVFHMYGLSNVLAKIAAEVPIMDGSALEFCNLVESAEIIMQDEPIDPVVITETVDLPLDGAKSLRVEPSDSLEVHYFMDYPQPIGKLEFHYKHQGPEHFKEEIAPARTFGFVKDMRMMDEMGLAGGGRLSNVVLLDEEKVVNPPLRFPDEFVRHKVLDIIGDFYLLGRPFQGRIIASQTGHTENIAMLRLIREKLKL